MTISRRVFMAVLATATTGAALCGIAVGRWARRRCESCHALVRRAHVIRDGQWRGAYCPNCGVDIDRGTWRLDTCGQDRVAATTVKHPRPDQVWDYAQVPFPNRALVVETDKPTATLKHIRL